VITLLAASLGVAAMAHADIVPFGVCAHLHAGDEYQDHERELQLMEEAGIRWARADFSWGYFEPKEGEWRFDVYDTIVADAKKHNVQLLPILCYNVDWAFPAHEHLDKWCEYVRTVVSRYQADLRYWEVWNEPNIGFWKPAPDATQYTDLLVATHQTIKAIDPGLQVVYGGTAGIPFDFIRKTFELGACKAFDVMAVHPYRYPRVPETSDLTTDLQKTWALLEEFGGRKPLWITEFGWPTHITPVVHDPGFLPQMIHYAATLRFPDRKQFSAAVLDEADLPGCRPLGPAINEGLNQLPDLTSRLVGLADLPSLQPDTAQILVMPTGESYPADFSPAMLEFVRKGGLLVHLGGVPFYYASRLKGGKWESPLAGNEARAALHIGWKAWWTENGLPAEAPTTKLAAPPESGIRVPEGVKSTRWLTDAKLQGNDRFVPLLAAYRGDQLIGYPVALYLYDSDLKGGFLGTILATQVSGVTEDIEALYLPRALLLSLGEGLENVFWYEFRDGGNDPAYNEHRFGIIRFDLTPKPAYRSYQTLTRALGRGRFLRKLDVGEGTYCYVFDAGGSETVAVWRANGSAEVSLKVSGEKPSALDYQGDPVQAQPAGGVLTLNATERVTYVTGLEAVEGLAR
jgi:hypothetical protein